MNGPATSLGPNATGTTLTLTPVGIMVGWIGDSISIQSTTNAPAQYGSQTRYVRNWAISGQLWTTGAIAVEYTNNVTNQTRIIAQGGVNDVIHGVSVATISATVFSFIDTRLAEGKQVAVCNLSPWASNSQWSASAQTDTLAYNALLVSGVAARPSVILVDIYSLLESAPGSGILKAAYDSGDGLHPNAAAGAVWAAQLAVQLP